MFIQVLFILAVGAALFQQAYSIRDMWQMLDAAREELEEISAMCQDMLAEIREEKMVSGPNVVRRFRSVESAIYELIDEVGKEGKNWRLSLLRAAVVIDAFIDLFGVFVLLLVAAAFLGVYLPERGLFNQLIGGQILTSLVFSALVKRAIKRFSAFIEVRRLMVIGLNMARQGAKLTKLDDLSQERVA